MKRKWTRREMLKTTATGAGAAIMGATLGGSLISKLVPDARAQGSTPTQSINSAVVIGSGVSGLTAAALLRDKGKEVTVIESCHRPGGRIQQVVFPNGQHASVAGSEWFDTDQNFWWLVKDYLGFRNQDIGVWSGDTFFWWKGQYAFCTGGWVPCVNKDMATNPDHVWDYTDLSRRIHDCILIEPFDNGGCYLGAEGETWDLQSAQAYLTQKYDADFADMMINNWLKAELGVSGDIVAESICNYSISYWFNDNSHSLKDGNGQIIQRLIDKLPQGSLLTDSPVKSVENTADGVTVRYKSDRINADVAIVAVPSNKVAGIVPDLPQEKIATLASLHDTHSILVLLQFSERFWLTQFGMHGWGGCADWLTVADGTMHQPGTEGILECYVTEPQAFDLWENACGIHVRGNGKERIVEAVLAKLDEFWPASQYYNGESKVYQWIPYIPNYPAGFVRDGSYTSLRDPIGNIHFAGEYVYGPGLESAVHIGRDVAARFQ